MAVEPAGRLDFAIMEVTGDTLSGKRWRRLQWIMIALWIVGMTILLALGISRVMVKGPSPYVLELYLVNMFAHGAWFTLESRIQKRPLGAWRFASLFGGPLVVWLYLVGAYRVRALVLIPLATAVYACPLVLIAIAIVLRLISPVTFVF